MDEIVLSIKTKLEFVNTKISEYQGVITAIILNESLLDRITSQIDLYLSDISSLFQQLKSLVQPYVFQVGGDIIVNEYQTLCKTFEETGQSYIRVKLKGKKRRQDLLIRKLKVVIPDIQNPELVVEQLENTDVFEKVILNIKSRDVLSYVTKQHSEIRQIESGIKEVEQLFKDFAILTQSQHLILDTVEKNVETSKVNVVEATVHLKKANRYKRCMIM